MNLLDKAISLFDPVAGLKRAKARAQLAVTRKYEGASGGRRTEGWRTAGTSANAAIDSSLTALRNRSRDLVRNNCYAEAAVREIVTNTVGTGILPQANRRKRNGKLERDDLINDYWAQWGETTLCDVEGAVNFYGLQSLIAQGAFEAGEILIRRVRVKDKNWPTRLQLLEPDHIDTSKNSARTEAGVRILNGIEVDDYNRKLAYWLFPHHPGDAQWGAQTSIRVDAKDIIHHYIKRRPGQLRGVPRLAPVLMRLRDFDDYEDAQLVRQKISACFTAFVHDIEAPEESSGTACSLTEKVQPGLVQTLPDGKTVTFASPPGVQNYGEFSSVNLHGSATGVGISYEALTGDYSGVNYSSAKMGDRSMSRNIKHYTWTYFIPQVCCGVWGWFLEDLILTNKLKQGAPIKESWTPPRREEIDGLKETLAAKERLRLGLTTLSSEIRERGEDPRNVFEERKRDNDELDRLGLKFDSDPRHDQRVQKPGEDKSNADKDGNDKADPTQ